MRHVGPSPVDVCARHAEVTMHNAAQQRQALADAILVNKTIEVVHLWNNQIGDEGVKARAQPRGDGCGAVDRRIQSNTVDGNHSPKFCLILSLSWGPEVFCVFSGSLS